MQTPDAIVSRTRLGPAPGPCSGMDTTPKFNRLERVGRQAAPQEMRT